MNLRVINETKTKRNPLRNRFAVSKFDAGETSEARNPTVSRAKTLNEQQFCHFTREGDVRFYTGLPSTEHFYVLNDYFISKADKMRYWWGPSGSSGEVTNEDWGLRRPQRTLKQKF